LVFLISALSLLWTEHIDIGLKSLETQLTLFLLPLIIGLNRPLDKAFSWVIFSFLGGLAVGLIKLYLVALQSYLADGEISAFFYAELSGDFHPSYLALYCVIGVAMVLFGKSIRAFSFSKWLFPILLILFSLSVVLLASKAGYLTLILVLANSLWLKFREKQKKESYYFNAILLLGSIVLIMLLPISQKRILSIKKNINFPESTSPINKTKRNSTQSRLIVWESAYEILLENKAGVGLGDKKQAMLDIYEAKGEFFILNRKYNAHNQFLESAVGSGWFGFLALLLTMLFLIVLSLNSKDYLLFVVVTVFLINLLTESMFERQSGVVFISLITSLLVFRNRPPSVT